MSELEELDAKEKEYLAKIKKRIWVAKNLAGLKMGEVAEIAQVCEHTFRKFMNENGHCFRDKRKLTFLESWVNRTYHINEKLNGRK